MTLMLKRGSEGRDVKAVQNALNFHLRLLTPLAADGKFGPKTEERVRQYQKLHNLAIDGVVGPRTTAALFVVETLPGQLLFMPQLTLPTSGLGPLRSPRLIPQLQFPGFLPPPTLTPPTLTPPIVLGPGIQLFSFTIASLPALDRPMLLDFTLTTPVRKDPSDPSVAARKNLVKMVDQLPVNAKFRAFLISHIPDPAKKIGYPTPGFDWGADLPSFNPLSPDKLGLSGDARYLIHVSGKPGSPLPFVTFGAWGDAKVELDYQSQQGRAGFTAKFDGKAFLGFQGVF